QETTGVLSAVPRTGLVAAGPASPRRRLPRPPTASERNDAPDRAPGGGRGARAVGIARERAFRLGPPGQRACEACLHSAGGGPGARALDLPSRVHGGGGRHGPALRNPG